MLNDSIMRSEPDVTSQRMDFSIPTGETVFAYKYMIEPKCWLINYNDNWGFIKDNLIMAISEQTEIIYEEQWDTPLK